MIRGCGCTIHDVDACCIVSILFGIDGTWCPLKLVLAEVDCCVHLTAPTLPGHCSNVRSTASVVWWVAFSDLRSRTTLGCHWTMRRASTFRRWFVQLKCWKCFFGIHQQSTKQRWAFAVCPLKRTSLAQVRRSEDAGLWWSWLDASYTRVIISWRCWCLMRKGGTLWSGESFTDSSSLWIWKPWSRCHFGRTATPGPCCHCFWIEWFIEFLELKDY